MGFFSHEAVGIDPRTGIVYLTEDDFRGVIDDDDPSLDTRSSFLYRFIPNNRRRRPGPFRGRDDAGRQRRLAAADPPAHLAPRISGELAQAAERHGLSRLEAAAYDRLGVPLT